MKNVLLLNVCPRLKHKKPQHTHMRFEFVNERSCKIFWEKMTSHLSISPRISLTNYGNEAHQLAIDLLCCSPSLDTTSTGLASRPGFSIGALPSAVLLPPAAFIRALAFSASADQSVRAKITTKKMTNDMKLQDTTISTDAASKNSQCHCDGHPGAQQAKRRALHLRKNTRELNDVIRIGRTKK